jgi:hypothetical protein
MKCVMVHPVEVYTHEAHTIIPFTYRTGMVYMNVTSIFYIHGSMHRNSILIRSNKMQRGKGHVGERLLFKYYDLYQRLQLQFYALLMTGAKDTRNT